MVSPSEARLANPNAPAMAVHISNALLRTLAVLFVLMFIYILYHSGHFFVDRPFSSLVMYSLPGAFALGLLLAERLSSAARVRLTIVIVEVGLCFYAGELALHLLPAVVASSPNASHTARLRQAKLNLLRELRRQGIDAVPVVSPGGFLVPSTRGLKARFVTQGTDLLPLGGAALKRVVDCDEGGGFLTYDADEHGFHNPRGLWRLARVDVAAVGDSSTHGNCVASDENFVARIRERYAATINLGKAGNGPLIELAGIQEYLRSVKPRVVLWFFSEVNDLPDLKVQKHSGLLMRYVLEDFSQSLINRQRIIDQQITGFTREIENDVEMELQRRPSVMRVLTRFMLATEVRRRLVAAYMQLVHVPFQNVHIEEQDYELFVAVLQKAAAVTDSWGGQLYFVYLPYFDRYRTAPITSLRYLDRLRNRVLRDVELLGIPVIDIHPVFASQSSQRALFSRHGPHYSMEGNAVVAQAVIERIAPAMRGARVQAGRR